MLDCLVLADGQFEHDALFGVIGGAADSSRPGLVLWLLRTMG